MNLSGSQRRKLVLEALIDAFPTTASLEQMLSFELDKSLRAIVGEGSLQEIVFRLIQTAEAQGWVEDLVRAARESNPGNAKLRDVAQKLLSNHPLKQDQELMDQTSPKVFMSNHPLEPDQELMDQTSPKVFMSNHPLKPDQELMNQTPPKVFISYSWDSDEHKDRVLALSDLLRREGVDCHIDQYVEFPSQGWPRWMENQLEWAEFVLVICTEQYHRRFRGQEEAGKGKGATWEGAIIAQELYEEKVNNTKFIPVIFSTQDSDHIPRILRPFSRYILDTEEGYEKLYRYLTNQKYTPIPDLGKRRTLPPRERKQDFDKASEEKEDYSQLPREEMVMVQELITKTKDTPVWQSKIGSLDYSDRIIDAKNSANVNLRDFIVEAKFYNPYNGDDFRWMYGFSFRETSSNFGDPQRKVYTLWISSRNKILFMEGPESRVEEEILNLNILENGFNKLRLFAFKETAIVFVNDVYIQKFDISELMIRGKVYVVSTGVMSESKSAKYENFKLWSISN